MGAVTIEVAQSEKPNMAKSFDRSRSENYEGQFAELRSQRCNNIRLYHKFLWRKRTKTVFT